MRTLESIAHSILILTLVLGLFLGYRDPEWVYNTFLIEDGPIENLTAFLMFLSAIVLLRMLWMTRSQGKLTSRIYVILMILGFIFLAGEEISWGQRVFDFSTPEALQAVNSQEEFNLHNLQFLGVDLNKLLFGKIISVAILGYLIGLPWLYRRRPTFGEWVNERSIPVPKLHHLIVFLLSLVLVMLSSSGMKSWELYELALSVVFLFVVLRPLNRRELVGAS